MSDNIDSAVLDGLSAGEDLVSYIRDQRYEPVSPEDSPVEESTEPAFAEPLTDAPTDDVPLQSAHAEPQVDQPPTGMAPPPAEPDQNLLNMLRQEREQNDSIRRMLNQQIIERFRAQEQAFQASIADLPEEERRVAVAEHRLELANAKAQLAENRANQLQQTTTANAESFARERAVAVMAQRYALNGTDTEQLAQASQFLPPDATERLAIHLGAVRASQSVPAPQVQMAQPGQALHPNAQTVAGGTPPPTPAPQRGTPRSGQLMDYIQGRNYTVQSGTPSGT